MIPLVEFGGRAAEVRPPEGDALLRWRSDARMIAQDDGVTYTFKIKYEEADWRSGAAISVWHCGASALCNAQKR